MTDSPYDKYYFEALKIMDQEDSTWAALYQLQQSKKEQTMRKPKTLTPDEKLLIALGKKAYFDLKRTSEIAIDAIEEMVARGDSPSQIQSLVIGQFPHLWVESQQIKAVAWYLLQGDIEED